MLEITPPSISSYTRYGIPQSDLISLQKKLSEGSKLSLLAA
jgi:hypothetical protein